MSGTQMAYAAIIRNAMSGTEIACAATIRYAMSGTDIPYAATRWYEGSWRTASTRLVLSPLTSLVITLRVSPSRIARIPVSHCTFCRLSHCATDICTSHCP
eukprot:135902-Rhodomonas_salina.1